MIFSDADSDELLTGLNGFLTLLDNCLCFKADITLGNGEEVRIVNELRPKIPTYRIVVREQSTGTDFRVTDGTTDWTKNYVYMRNAGTDSGTATVLFFYDNRQN